MTPFIRHMILCDDARPRASQPGKIDVFGLVNSVTVGGAFPARVTFCVYLAMTEGRGTGKGQVVVTGADEGETTYEGAVHEIAFDPDPLKVAGAIIRISSCSFATPGLYFVEFRYNGQMLARQPLIVRAES